MLRRYGSWSDSLAVLVSLLATASAAGAQPVPAPSAPAGAAQPGAPAAAQPAGPDAVATMMPADPDASKKEEAKQRFLRGVELSKTQDWDAALVEFLASREVYPTRAAIANAASALTTLRRYAEAVDMHREMLARFGDSMTPDQRKAVEDAIGQLIPRVGSVAVEGAVPGTRIVIDGQERGVTPLPRAILVNAGTHSVRAFKEGFLPFEGQVLVAGSKKTTVSVKLQPMAKSGRLRVTETSGKKFEVVVDGSVVGETPWEGDTSLGVHSVMLRGAGRMGTPPSTVDIAEARTAALNLTAVLLDATLRVEPSPSNAHVFVDGVDVGAGVWEGSVRSGVRKVEVSAPGFIADRQDARIERNKRAVVAVSLERNPSDPMWAAIFRPHIYLTASAGPFMALGFGGSADDACGGCDRSIPFGWVAGLRGGYQATSGLGIELMVGYLDFQGSMKRPQTADGDPHVRSLTTEKFEDAARLGGPTATLSASYTFLDKTPLTIRLWGGAARMKARFQGKGTFDGVSRNPDDPSEEGSFSLRFDLAERDENIWVPMVGPEVRIGYKITKKFIVDVGVAGYVMFAPETPRVARGGGPRAINSGDSPGATYPSGAPIPQAGQVTLPSEKGFGTMLGLAPTVGARYDF